MTGVEGKRLLLVGVKDARKDFIWTVAADIGIQLYVVGTAEEVKNKVAKFIFYDTNRHQQDDVSCDVIASLVESQLGDVDGCMTLWDDDIPLTALLCHRLEKPGLPPAAAAAAKSKSKTFEALRKAAEEGKCVGQYLSRCQSVSTLDEVEHCCSEVGLPAVMKTEHGGGAYGTRIVTSVDEAKEQWKAIQSLHDTMTNTNRNCYMSTTLGREVAMMELLSGSEHCVDLALFHGELICAFLTDKGQPLPPDTFHTVTVLPSLLAPEKQQQVIDAALQCCLALGLDHGVLDVDLMLTSSGPKLIEINARMGGLCQREFVLHGYGVDLLVLAVMTALDVKPELKNRDVRTSVTDRNNVTDHNSDNSDSNSLMTLGHSSHMPQLFKLNRHITPIPTHGDFPLNGSSQDSVDANYLFNAKDYAVNGDDTNYTKPNDVNTTVTDAAKDHAANGDVTNFILPNDVRPAQEVAEVNGCTANADVTNILPNDVRPAQEVAEVNSCTANADVTNILPNDVRPAREVAEVNSSTANADVTNILPNDVRPAQEVAEVNGCTANADVTNILPNDVISAQEVAEVNGCTANADVTNSTMLNGVKAATATSDVSSPLPIPPCQSVVVGLSLYGWRHGKVLKTTARPDVLQALHDKHQLIFIRNEAFMREERGGIPFCTLAARDVTWSAARAKLRHHCELLGIDAPELDVDSNDEEDRHLRHHHC